MAIVHLRAQHAPALHQIGNERHPPRNHALPVGIANLFWNSDERLQYVVQFVAVANIGSRLLTHAHGALPAERRRDTHKGWHLGSRARIATALAYPRRGSGSSQHEFRPAPV